MSWDLTKHSYSPFGQANVLEAGRGKGGLERSPPSLGVMGVLATGRSEALVGADPDPRPGALQIPPEETYPG